MNKTQWLSVVSVVILLMLTSSKASAWGQAGHRAVCAIAFEQMQPTTKRIVKRLLKELPAAHKQRLNAFQKRTKRSDIDFASACVWADTIRDQPGYQGFSAWHYVNVARDAAAVDSAGCLKGCVLEAIPLHQRVLAESNHSWTKLQALMFLGHWVADIHQPLHVGFKDDKGGNMLSVRIGDDETNFHRLWDSGIINWAMALNGWDDAALIDSVKAVPARGYELGYSLNAPAIWAEESRLLAQKPRTGYCEQNKGECRKPRGRQPYVLDSGYYAQHWPDVRLRLKLAGLRLAAAIDNALE